MSLPFCPACGEPWVGHGTVCKREQSGSFAAPPCSPSDPPDLPEDFGRDEFSEALRRREESFRRLTGIEADVCEDIQKRRERGLKKYGVSVANNPLPLKAWLQHAYEETLDQAIYLKRAIQEMENKQISD